jgi:hypothetical protein
MDISQVRVNPVTGQKKHNGVRTSAVQEKSLQNNVLSSLWIMGSKAGEGMANQYA